eukprot:COSAG06_NODE_1124_length_10620_cov_48.182587_8_plen_455_part_00
MDIFENALSDGSDANAKLEAELASDTDAVVSVVYSEQTKLGELLSTSDGAPSPLFRALQLEIMATAVALATMAPDALAPAAGMERPNELLRLFGVLFGVAGALLALPLHSARITLQPGGALERLRAGKQKISEADAAGIGRARMGLAVLSAGFVLAGLLELGAGILGVVPGTDVAFPPQGRTVLVLHGLFFIFLAPVMFSGWWPPMATACCLCRDNITEAIRKVRDTDPANDDSKDPQAWLDNVATPTLALREPMDELSGSLGPGVLGASSCIFFAALAWFANAVNDEFCVGADAMLGLPPGTNHHFWLWFAVLWTVLSLLIVKDAASTSSRCDLLMAELNAAGIKHGPKHHSTFEWLECRLKRLNDGQGIGFKLGHTVVNRTFLTVLGAKLLGSLATFYTIIISLGDAPAASASNIGEDMDACQLNGIQIGTIQLQLNASCFYNVTLDAILGY